jgi:hypothetical protein
MMTVKDLFIGRIKNPNLHLISLLREVFQPNKMNGCSPLLVLHNYDYSRLLRRTWQENDGKN